MSHPTVNLLALQVSYEVVEKVETEQGARYAIERLDRERGGSMWRATSGTPRHLESGERRYRQGVRAAPAPRGGSARSGALGMARCISYRGRPTQEPLEKKAPRLPRERSYEIEPESVELALALANLWDCQRSAVVLHYIADKPVAEVAAILGTTSGTVKVHLSRARRRLRAELGEQE